MPRGADWSLSAAVVIGIQIKRPFGMPNTVRDAGTARLALSTVSQKSNVHSSTRRIEGPRPEELLSSPLKAQTEMIKPLVLKPMPKLILLFVTAVLLVGCGGAQFTKARVDPTYRPPREISLQVVSNAKGEGLPEAQEKLAKELQAQLAARGITAKVVPAISGEPSVNVTVAKWDAGSRALRYFVGFGAGKAEMNLVVQVSPEADSPPKAEAEMSGWINSGAWGGDATNAGKELGKKLADAIATGNFKVED